MVRKNIFFIFGFICIFFSIIQYSNNFNSSDSVRQLSYLGNFIGFNIISITGLFILIYTQIFSNQKDETKRFRNFMVGVVISFIGISIYFIDTSQENFKEQRFYLTELLIIPNISFIIGIIFILLHYRRKLFNKQ